MRRRFFSILSAMSLPLCMATCALWVRSYQRVDVLSIAGARDYRASSGGGGVVLECPRMVRRVGDWRTGTNTKTQHLQIFVESPIDYRQSRRKSGLPMPGTWTAYLYINRTGYAARGLTSPFKGFVPQISPVNRFVLSVYDNVTYQADEQWLLGSALWIPYWIPALFSAIPPLLWLRRRRTIGIGCCPACGYDLRATPDRCPECGTTSQKVIA